MTKRIPADERRQELMRVAERLFATRPYGDISVQEIADEAGVARGLIHHYFGGKDDILAAVMRELTPSRGPIALDTSLPLRTRVEQRVDMLMNALAEQSQAWLATLALGSNMEPGPLKDAAHWIENYRKFWEASLDRLEEYLSRLQTGPAKRPAKPKKAKAKTPKSTEKKNDRN